MAFTQFGATMQGETELGDAPRGPNDPKAFKMFVKERAEGGMVPQTIQFYDRHERRWASEYHGQFEPGDFLNFEKLWIRKGNLIVRGPITKLGFYPNWKDLGPLYQVWRRTEGGYLLLVARSGQVEHEEVFRDRDEAEEKGEELVSQFLE